MLTLHKPDSVFSLRHVPSWLMLCFAAGAVNATSMLACSRFVTHVTGTVTRIGAEVAHLNLMLDFALVLAWFIAGAFAAGLMLHGSVYRGKRPPFSLPLWAAAGITSLVALMGHVGWLGPFGGDVDQLGDFLHLCALGFAMGLQNAAVATSTGQLVRTTHLTGPATDLGV
ncbi:MAG TPA: YoaK family protein, partial [Polyangiales bacterium]|nr:YoaK family protein [Polyangiales bacterium]